MLSVENLEAGYGGCQYSEGVSMSIGRNESVALIRGQWRRQVHTGASNLRPAACHRRQDHP
jgi:hypothetical protein